MPQKATKNIFADGVDKDTHPKYVEASKMTNASNISLTRDGNMHAPTNLKEASAYASIDTAMMYTNPDVLKVLGTIQVRGKWTDDTTQDMILTWVLSTDSSYYAYKIYATALEDNSSITVYSDTSIDKDAFAAADPYISAAKDTTAVVDTVIFTNGYNKPNKLTCDFSTTSPYSLPRTEEELQLQRFAAPGTLGATIAATGHLLAGKYIFYYRLVNPTTNLYTAWSQAAKEISIAGSDLNGQVGTVTNKSILLTVVLRDSAVYSLFSHVQFGVIPMTSGDLTLPVTGYTLPLRAFTGSSISEYIKANEYEAYISIGELVTEQAPLATANSVQIKNNRAFLGGVTYATLDYDNGTPAVTGAIASTTAYPASTTETQKGYFRDEVYRFYVAFYDENGNYSRPKELDLSGITGNTISGATDLKFPPRNADGDYTVLTASSAPSLLYLQLTSLTNIPTWARGATILRAKRKKNILFQSPMIPGVYLEPAGAVGNYPQQAYGESSADTTRQIKSSTPIYTPKNMFYPLHKNYYRGGSLNYETLVKAQSGSKYYPSLWYVFPPSYIYTQNGLSSLEQYEFNTGQSVDIVDLAVLKVKEHTVHSTPPNSENEADYVDTNVSATLFAVSADDYYYHASDSKSALAETSVSIKEYVELLESSTSGEVLTGATQGVYTSLVDAHDTIGVDNLVEGVTPINQKMAAITIDSFAAAWGDAVAKVFNYNVTSTSEIDNTYYTAIRAGSRTTWAGIDYTKVSSATSWADSYLNINRLFSIAGTYTANDYVQAAYIVNITAGLGDDRYGEAGTYYELIPITTIAFESANYASIAAGTYTYSTTIGVYGGDCYIAPHTFKVHDTIYSISNIDATTNAGATASEQWGHSFERTAGGLEVRRQIPLKGAAAAITVMLESEVNPFWLDRSNYNSTVTGLTAPNLAYASTSSADIRQPMDYTYNQAYSLENTVKAFIPYSPIDQDVTDYKARIHFSNLRIQNTKLEGFDVWSSSDFYDMDETYGPIYAIPKARDNMFTLQKDAIAYIPLGERVLEQSTTANIAVRTGDVINQPVYISTKYGTEDPRSVVVNNNDVIFFMDRGNKKVLSLAGQEYDIISNYGLSSEFNTILASTYLSDTQKSEIVGFYNEHNQEYWIGAKIGAGSNSFLWAWDDRSKHWIGKLPHLSGYTTGNQYAGFIMHDGTIYTPGATSASQNFIMYKLYGASTYHQGEITFIVNPDADFVKVFDNLIYSSTGASGGRITSIVLKTYRDSGLPLQSQTISQSILSGAGPETNTIEDLHKLKILRDANDARLRGTYLEVTMKWDSNTTSEQIPLSSVLTKYRLSKRVD